MAKQIKPSRLEPKLTRIEEVKKMEIAKWRDGSDKICGVCGELIYTTQPMVGTITQAPKKRHSRHFLCSPTASITLIGNGQVAVFKGKGGTNERD